VTHTDVQKIFLAVLRHRIILNYEAKIAGVTADSILLELAGQVLLT
jgi:MoxR-like ATPase